VIIVFSRKCERHETGIVGLQKVKNLQKRRKARRSLEKRGILRVEQGLGHYINSTEPLQPFAGKLLRQYWLFYTAK
jgi:hypothetical protein